MKQLLNKTLTVKQIAALVVLPLAVLMTVIVFSIGNNNDVTALKNAPVKDSVVSLNPLPSDTTALGKLYSYVDSLNKADQLFGGSWSFCLADADSGKNMCGVNIDRGMVPASVMKVVSTGTALSILGPKFRFTTTFTHDSSYFCGFFRIYVACCYSG